MKIVLPYSAHKGFDVNSTKMVGGIEKFIKDVVEGTIERKEMIEETIDKYLKEDINLQRTDKILKIILFMMSSWIIIQEFLLSQ